MDVCNPGDKAMSQIYSYSLLYLSVHMHKNRQDNPLTDFGGNRYSPIITRKTPDTRHADGGRYGNGIFHCILGVKEKALFDLTQIEWAEVSFRFVLQSKTNSSPNEVRLVCQTLRLILYPFPSFLRLVYLRQPSSGLFLWR
ncbi:hypothetical protein AVEN_4601-1 [Araneus ventricosus]|uniref:Uncharacterized protein n=1 Tax=Araneus ventricosus TaxID=182803 RepID=A0A4Y2VLY5_ARAVE|nr:hypothetical protein AVEN_4601-1 [Araneus ventricosus]